MKRLRCSVGPPGRCAESTRRRAVGYDEPKWTWRSNSRNLRQRNQPEDWLVLGRRRGCLAGDDVNGYLAQETVASLAEVLPWVQEAIAHFYPNSTYAQALDPAISERAAKRLFQPPRV